MDTIYVCTNKNCSFPGSNPFEMTFKSETIMDANNVASLFCPFCKEEMSPSPSSSDGTDESKDR